ncbi:MAG: tRNA (adenosine(37)-N6)-threonylcarbamoyltransferase complex transferase subunit TsaD [Parvularculaceae bacterium]
MNGDLLFLGLETSCDDTAAAVVARRRDGCADVLSNAVWTQFDAHEPYGGVVPEIAARSHVERLDLVAARAMAEAGAAYGDLAGVAATAGPGLVGGVMVGLTMGKAVALAHDLPLIPINHLEGHALSPRLTDEAPFPYLLLLISGGHTQLIAVDDLDAYRRLGTTIDDAAGEAFDKTAKLLGLGQPGGPAVERAATTGDAGRFAMPAPLIRRPGCDFSFSGLKTAVRLAAEGLDAPSVGDVADVAAAAQAAIAAHLAERTRGAMVSGAIEFSGAPPTLVVAGGVAANGAVRDALRSATESLGWRLIVPPVEYCADNGAMIAWAGAERFAAGLAPSRAEADAFAPRARWPLAAPPADAAFGGGKKGPKA